MWKPVVGYEEYYDVSDTGEIYSKISNRLRKQVVNKVNGYAYVMLSNPKGKTKKSMAVHRIVAEAWLPDSKSECVNHKNENKLDNRVTNLEWCTKAYNNTYNSKTQRSCKRIAMCDKHTGEILKIFPSARIAEKGLETNYKNISAVCHGKRPTAGGYRWKFV